MAEELATKYAWRGKGGEKKAFGDVRVAVGMSRRPVEVLHGSCGLFFCKLSALNSAARERTRGTCEWDEKAVGINEFFF